MVDGSRATRTSTRGASTPRTTRPRRSSADIRAVGVQSFPDGTAADPNRRFLGVRDQHVRPLVAPVAERVRRGRGRGQQRQRRLLRGRASTRVLLFRAPSTETYVVAVFSTRSAGASILFLADAPTNGETPRFLARPVEPALPKKGGGRRGEPCLTLATNPRFTYRRAVVRSREQHRRRRRPGGLGEVQLRGLRRIRVGPVRRRSLRARPVSVTASRSIAPEFALSPRTGSDGCPHGQQGR